MARSASAGALCVLSRSGGRTFSLGTTFKKLNEDWDVEAGAPEPSVRTDESGLTLTFFLRSSLNSRLREYDRGEIFFPNCWRYRLGYPNDEGWDRGHCRFRCWAPAWGDFYEVTGDLLDNAVKDWVSVKPTRLESSRHFLLLQGRNVRMRCGGLELQVLRISDADYVRLVASRRRVALQRTTLLDFARDLLFAPVRVAKGWLGRRNNRRRRSQHQDPI